MGPTEQCMSGAHGIRRKIMIWQPSLKSRMSKNPFFRKFSTFHSSRELNQKGSNALDKSQKEKKKKGKIKPGPVKNDVGVLTIETQEACG